MKVIRRTNINMTEWFDMEDYPRALSEKHKNFDPIKLAHDTERIVCNGELRKYTRFYVDEDAYGGIVTADATGCCLRCFFCWADKGRDYPELYGEFYTPEEVFKKLKDIADNRKINIIRLSGAEPTLCREHLFKFLSLIEETEYDFTLETNGILLSEEEYVKQLSQYKKPRVRVSLKAGTPDQFAKKTGATPESFELQFIAIRNLLKYDINFTLAAATDPRIMGLPERDSLLEKLEGIDHSLISMLDEEIFLPDNYSLKRIEEAGISTLSFSVPASVTKFLRRLPIKPVRWFMKRILYKYFNRTSNEKEFS